MKLILTMLLVHDVLMREIAGVIYRTCLLPLDCGRAVAIKAATTTHFERVREEGKQHGEGKYILPSGIQRRGEWKDGHRERWVDAASHVSTAATSIKINVDR